jgi:hypothetical protein
MPSTYSVREIWNNPSRYQTTKYIYINEFLIQIRSVLFYFDYNIIYLGDYSISREAGTSKMTAIGTEYEIILLTFYEIYK